MSIYCIARFPWTKAILLVGLLLCHAQQTCFASLSTADWMKKQAEQLPKDEVEQYWDHLIQKYGGFFPEGKVPSFREMIIPGGKGLSLHCIFHAIGTFLMYEILFNGKLLVTIVMLNILSIILQTLQSAFEKNNVSKIGYAICYMVIIVIAINSFKVAIGYAKEAIDSMIHFMMAMLPLLFTLLASMGNVVTVAVTHPIIVLLVHTVGTAIHTCVFPLLLFSAVIHFVSSISDKYKLTQLAELMRNVSMVILSVLLTVFLGVISVQGASSAVMDGVSLKAAKYIAGNFIPVLGRVFADATDTVMTTSLLVKNAVGLTGVIIILFLCLFPALKIITIAFIYNVTAAIMQPLGDTPIVNCLQVIGKSLIYVFAALAAVGFMFFMAITILLMASSISVMIK